MTMLKVHADALNDVNVAYHEFLLNYKASTNIVYGIVEGKEDPMFYIGLIEQQLPEGWEVELVTAGCKKKRAPCSRYLRLDTIFAKEDMLLC